nr:hypothetical protein [Tanacetum cinerariifolium]
MIAVNNRKDSVSPPRLVTKPKKGKSWTVAPTLPKSQGPEDSGALPKKRTKPKIGAKYQEDQTQSSRLRYQSLTENEGEPFYEGDLDIQPLILSYADVRAILLSKDEAQESDEEEQHKEAAVSYTELKASIDQYYDENIAHKDQTDKLVKASMSSLDRIKDDPATNQKINEATETFVRISSHATKILSLVKGFDLSALLSIVKSILDHVVKQEEATAAWMKTFTNMAWSLSYRISGVELSQTALKREISSLRQDTSKIKSMMTKMYATFQGRPSSAPSGRVTPTLALADIQKNIKGENATTTATEEPPSHAKGETEEPRLEISISLIPSIVVRKKEKKLGSHPKEAISTKVGELFKKAQDAKHEVLKRQHTKKVRKHHSYMWTVSSRLKPEPIIDIKIHPKIKPVVITVYRGTDGRNFDVH